MDNRQQEKARVNFGFRSMESLLLRYLGERAKEALDDRIV